MYRTIDGNNALEAAFQPWPDSAPLMCDCEFVRERTYWPELGLLQLGRGEQALLVDPLTLDDPCIPLRTRLQSSLIVMHAPGEDLECFLTRFGWLPKQLFDTQAAAAFCGLGAGLGYRALVHVFCGIELEKGETRSDWLARPLSESQLRYAAEDVTYLGSVFEALQERLRQRGFSDWFEQDCIEVLRRAQLDFSSTSIQLEPKSCYRLDIVSIARWRLILAWREKEARERNRPKGWIIDNETARNLAQAPPGNKTAHDRVIAASNRVAKTAGPALWESLQSVQPNQEDAWLAKVGNEKQDRQRLKCLQDAVAKEAERLDLPAGLLMSRKRLESLLDRRSWPAEVGGWRRDLLQPVLLPLVS